MREHLIAGERTFLEYQRRARSDPDYMPPQLLALERGAPVVVQGWQLPPAARGRFAHWTDVRVEADGSLTEVRPVVHFPRRLDGTQSTVPHRIDEVEVGPDGDRSPIVIEAPLIPPRD